tara:strand:- start:46478 stop:46732 length:255 start_codon:yes stop_codon:yes gene_type:complete
LIDSVAGEALRHDTAALIHIKNIPLDIQNRLPQMGTGVRFPIVGLIVVTPANTDAFRALSSKHRINKIAMPKKAANPSFSRICR